MNQGRRRCTVIALTLAALGQFAWSQSPLVPGRNVNMVSGTSFPDGDPYLQRQNEPSLAVSSRNPLHLLAGANDYRAVDLPGLTAGNTKFSVSTFPDESCVVTTRTGTDDALTRSGSRTVMLQGALIGTLPLPTVVVGEPTVIPDGEMLIVAIVVGFAS